MNDPNRKIDVNISSVSTALIIIENIQLSFLFSSY